MTPLRHTVIISIAALLLGASDARAIDLGLATVGTLPATAPTAAEPALGAPETVVAYASYLGGSSRDAARFVAVDAAGFVYLAGETRSEDFPGTAPGECGGVRSGVFLTKLTPDARQVVFSACLRETSGLSLTGLAVAGDGANAVAVVTGFAFALTGVELPVAAAIQPFHGGGVTDGYVAGFDASTGALRFATYFGGTGDDRITGVAAGGGLVYLAGWTTSTAKFPTPAAGTTAFQPSRRGTSDAFVAALAPDGSHLYGTYLGGYDRDEAWAVDVGSDGDVYVAGRTASSRFPMTKDAFDSTCGSLGDCDRGEYGAAVYGPTSFPLASDAFVARLDPTLSQLRYSSYLGGKGADWARGLAVAPGGAIQLGGATASGDLPVRGGGCLPLDALPGAPASCVAPAPYGAKLAGWGVGGLNDGFALRLDDDGRSLGYSTFLLGAQVGPGPLTLRPDGRVLLVQRFDGSGVLAPGMYELDAQGVAVTPVASGQAIPAALAVDARGDLQVVGAESAGSVDPFACTGDALQPERLGSQDATVSRWIECATGVAPAGLSLGYAGRSAVVDVATSRPDCPWSAASEAAWIRVDTPRGRGAGSVAFSVSPNPTSAPRSATLRVAGHDVHVHQSGRPAPTLRPARGIAFLGR